jgi:hypothetical protein
MTIRHAIELDTISLLAISAVAGIVFAVYFNHKPNTRYSFSLPVMEAQDSTLTPVPSDVPVFAPEVETFSQVSPDGTNKLTMTATANKDASKTYTFTTSDAANTNQKSIYTITLPNTENMGIPFNTWSPDNAYVFLQHNKASSSGAIVMKANGEQLAEGQQYFDVATLFNARNTGNTYQETTGWASETLLIINTTQPDGTKGPSYWLEIPSKAVIPLSTQF